MRVRIHQAVIGFCENLTDPNGVCLPIAVLIIAEGADELYAGLIGGSVEPAPNRIDPFTESMLREFPELLKRHVDEAFVSFERRPTIPQLLHSVHNSLRNSFQVTRILEPTTVEIESRDVFPRLYVQALSTLFSEITAAGLEVELSVAVTSRVAPISQSRHVGIRAVQPASLWPLSSQRPREAQLCAK